MPWCLSHEYEKIHIRPRPETAAANLLVQAVPVPVDPSPVSSQGRDHDLLGTKDTCWFVLHEDSLVKVRDLHCNLKLLDTVAGDAWYDPAVVWALYLGHPAINGDSVGNTREPIKALVNHMADIKDPNARYLLELSIASRS